MATKKPISQMSKDFANMVKGVQKFKNLVFNTQKDLAEWTTDYMRKSILSQKKRKSSRPSETSIVNKIKTSINKATGNYLAIGIVNLRELPKYWRIINYGGMISPKARFLVGRFNGKAPKGEWIMDGYQGNNPKLIVVKKPIKGMFYIERTMIATGIMVNKVQSKLGKIWGSNIGLTVRLENRIPELKQIGKVKYKK